MEAQPLKLHITKGPRAGETLEFRPGCRVRIGRVVRGNNVAIKDAGISSKHLALDVDAESGKWVLQDLGSSNGTFLNEASVSPDKPYLLRDGDVVKIGECTSISVELSSALVESKSRRNPRRGAPSRGYPEGDAAARVSTVSEMNESKECGGGRVLKCEVVDLDPGVGLGNAGTLKEKAPGPARVSPRRTRGRKKAVEKNLDSGSVIQGASLTVEGRRTRAGTRRVMNLDEQKQVDVPENDYAVKEMNAGFEKVIEEVEVVNSGAENEDKQNLLSNDSEEHGVKSEGKKNESKRTRAASGRRKQLDEEKQLGVSTDAEMLHTVEEARDEGREDKEDAVMLNCGEEDGNVKLAVVGTDGVAEPNLGGGLPDFFDNRGSHDGAGSEDEPGVNENSREDGVLPDLTKMTLREWFDLLEVHLPKQIINETEKMISEMRSKAVRVREYVAEQKNNKCKEPVR